MLSVFFFFFLVVISGVAQSTAANSGVIRAETDPTIATRHVERSLSSLAATPLCRLFHVVASFDRPPFDGGL